MPVASVISAELRALAAALAFLTRLPVGRWITLDGDDVARAGPLFPVVGAGIGAVVGAVTAALTGTLSPFLAATLALATGTLLTGALHLDALVDTADALGAQTRQHALEIMRDHAIGAYGATALGLDLLIKAASLASLARHERVLQIAIAAICVSRAGPVVLAAALPYVRAEGGIGASIAATTKARAALAAAAALAIATGVAGRDGLAVGGVAVVVVLLLGLCFRRWLRGITGDTLGATAELSELAALITGVAVVGR